MDNTVFGNNYGFVGSGDNNIVVNHIGSNWELFDGIDRPSNIDSVILNISFLDVFNEFAYDIAEKIEEGEQKDHRPIAIEVNEFVDYCARLLYNNGVTESHEAWEIINHFFSSICILIGRSYNVNCIKVGNNIYYELS